MLVSVSACSWCVWPWRQLYHINCRICVCDTYRPGLVWQIDIRISGVIPITTTGCQEEFYRLIYLIHLSLRVYWFLEFLHTSVFLNNLRTYFKKKTYYTIFPKRLKGKVITGKIKSFQVSQTFPPNVINLGSSEALLLGGEDDHYNNIIHSNQYSQLSLFSFPLFFSYHLSTHIFLYIWVRIFHHNSATAIAT